MSGDLVLLIIDPLSVTLVDKEYGKETEAHEALILVVEPLGVTDADNAEAIICLGLESKVLGRNLTLEKNDLLHGQTSGVGVVVGERGSFLAKKISR